MIEKFLKQVAKEDITKQGGNISALFYSCLLPGLWPSRFNKYYDFKFGPLVFVGKRQEGTVFFDLKSYQGTTTGTYYSFRTQGAGLAEMQDYATVCRFIDREYESYDLSTLANRSIVELGEAMTKYIYGVADLIAPTVFCESLDEELIKRYYLEIAPDLSGFGEFSEKSALPAFTSLAVQTDRHLLEFAKNHDLNCRWLLSNYYICPTQTEAPRLLNEMIEHKQGVDRIRAEIAQLEDKTQSSIEQLRLYRSELPDSLKTLLDFVQMSMKLRDDRKAYAQKLILMMSDIAREICRRLDLPEAALAYFKYDDFTSGKYLEPGFSAEAQNRINDAAYYFDEFGSGIVPGKADEVLAELYRQMDDNADQEIRGMSACKGQVTGRVKVVLHAEQFSKFEPGDILVTSMTRPEFVPLMKKASAVITDEGGVTCHAAIISRELGLPCIIGTKNATRKLKDGDMVEVDADRGIVMILVLS